MAITGEIGESAQLRVIGTRPIRHDGLDKVTGRAIYGPDFKATGMLHGRILRSPHAHALIHGFDLTAAQALPGVRAVVTGSDLPEPLTRDDRLGTFGGQPCIPFGNVMAREKVLYRGHAVAAVAATTAEIAEQALKLIKVDYEALPPVMRGRDAMQPGAPLLHPEITTLTLAGRGRGDREEGATPSNVATHHQVRHGDAEAGFKAADVIVEREFDIGNAHQGYIEPHNATALWNPDGAITIWCSSQGTFRIRDQVAQVLRVPPSRIKVVPLEVGGGFGGKVPAYIEPVAAVLSRQTGRPVRILMNRHEIFEGTGPAASAYVRAKLGATKEGRLTAAELELVYDAGAYPGSPVGAGMGALDLYRIEHVAIDGYDVVVNKPKVAPYRAPGAPQAVFAVESVVDELCQQLSLDPIAFRLINAVRQGDRSPEGVAFGKIGFVPMLEAARQHPHYTAPLTGPNQGRGVAACSWHVGGSNAACVINVNIDGTASLVEGAVDIGGTRVAIAMAAAEVLQIPAEDVHPAVVDTDSIGWTSGTTGSSTAYKGSWAAHDAALDVITQMRQRAARIWETDIEGVSYVNGVFQSSRSADAQMTFKQLAARLNTTGGPISGQAALTPRGGGASFTIVIVDVEVDPDTGKVQVLRCTALEDVGRALHPSYVEGQIQGGVVQGIGWALTEAYDFDPHGRMLNASFLDYRMPTTLDVPMIDTVLFEFPSPNHPFGVKGVGEPPIVPPLPAVANAVARAVGVRPTTLPINPGRLLEALWAKDGGGSE